MLAPHVDRTLFEAWLSTQRADINGGGLKFSPPNGAKGGRPAKAHGTGAPPVISRVVSRWLGNTKLPKDAKGTHPSGSNDVELMISDRAAVELLHNATPKTAEMLAEMLQEKSPAEITEMLRKNDVQVTNQKDKHVQLPKILQMDEQVRLTFSKGGSPSPIATSYRRRGSSRSVWPSTAGGEESN